MTVFNPSIAHHSFTCSDCILSDSVRLHAQYVPKAQLGPTGVAPVRTVVSQVSDVYLTRVVGYTVVNSPPPKPLRDAQMGGAFFCLG